MKKLFVMFCLLATVAMAQEFAYYLHSQSYIGDLEDACQLGCVSGATDGYDEKKDLIASLPPLPPGGDVVPYYYFLESSGLGMYDEDYTPAKLYQDLKCNDGNSKTWVFYIEELKGGKSSEDFCFTPQDGGLPAFLSIVKEGEDTETAIVENGVIKHETLTLLKGATYYLKYRATADAREGIASLGDENVTVVLEDEVSRNLLARYREKYGDAFVLKNQDGKVDYLVALYTSEQKAIDLDGYLLSSGKTVTEQLQEDIGIDKDGSFKFTYDRADYRKTSGDYLDIAYMEILTYVQYSTGEASPVEQVTRMEFTEPALKNLKWSDDAVLTPGSQISAASDAASVNVEFSWTEVLDATSYDVYAINSVNGYEDCLAAGCTGTSVNIKIDKLGAYSTLFRWYVVAKAEGFRNAYSPVQSFSIVKTVSNVIVDRATANGNKLLLHVAAGNVSKLASKADLQFIHGGQRYKYVEGALGRADVIVTEDGNVEFAVPSEPQAGDVALVRFYYGVLASDYLVLPVRN